MCPLYFLRFDLVIKKYDTKRNKKRFNNKIETNGTHKFHFDKLQ